MNYIRHFHTAFGRVHWRCVKTFTGANKRWGQQEVKTLPQYQSKIQSILKIAWGLPTLPQQVNFCLVGWPAGDCDAPPVVVCLYLWLYQCYCARNSVPVHFKVQTSPQYGIYCSQPRASGAEVPTAPGCPGPQTFAKVWKLAEGRATLGS